MCSYQIRNLGTHSAAIKWYQASRISLALEATQKWTTSLDHTQGSPFALICLVCGLDVSPVVYVWAAWTVKPLYIHVIYNHRFIPYNDVIMGAIASQITSLTIVYSTVHSDTDQRKHQNSASLAFVRGIQRGPVNSPHKWPVTLKMFPFDDVIMLLHTISKRKRIHRMQCVLLTCVLYLDVLTTFPDIISK